MKKLKQFFVLVVAIALLFSNLTLAVDDPKGTPSYPHIGEGGTYGYNRAPDGRLDADLSHSVSQTEVDPGTSITATVEARFISGSGDGRNGTDELKDILLVIEDYNGSVLTPVPGFNVINSQHLDAGEVYSETVSFNAPSAPGVYRYEYGLADYGKFKGVWQHAIISEGYFEITVRDLTPPPATTREVRIQPIIYEYLDGTLYNNLNAGYVRVYTDDQVISSGQNSGYITADLPDGTVVWIEAVANSGYNFKAWRSNLNSDGSVTLPGESGYIPNPGSITVNGADVRLSVSAVFEDYTPPTVSFTIDFDPGLGSLEPGVERIIVEQGGSFVEPIPTRDGWTFVEWSYVPTIDINNVQSSSTATAVWTQNTYTITFDPAGGTLESGDESFVVAEGGSFTPPTPTRDGYTFDGWSYSPTININDVRSDSTATANWTPVSVSYTITFDPAGGVLESGQESIIVAEGDSIVPPTPTRTGYTFDGWTYSPSININDVRNDSAATAIWTPIVVNYTITFDPAGGTLQAGEESVIVESGGSFSEPVPIREGWEFVRWDYTPEVDPANVLTSSLATAVWEETLYLITFDPNGGVLAVEDSSVTVPEGGTFTEPVPTREGWVFDGWTYSVAVDPDNVTTDASAIANWIPLTYTITFDPAGGVILGSDTLVVQAGGSFTAPTPTLVGFNFLGWNYSPAVDTGNVQNDSTATAQWEQIIIDPNAIEVFALFGTEDQLGLSTAGAVLFDFDGDGVNELVETVNFKVFSAEQLTDFNAEIVDVSTENIYEKRFYIPDGDNSVTIPFNTVEGYDELLYIAFEGDDNSVFLAEIGDFFTWYNNFYSANVISYDINADNVVLTVNTSNINLGSSKEEVQLLSYLALTVLYEPSQSFGDETTPEDTALDSDFLDEDAPEAEGELPESGGLPAVIHYGTGSAIAALGLLLRKRKK